MSCFQNQQQAVPVFPVIPVAPVCITPHVQQPYEGRSQPEPQNTGSVKTVSQILKQLGKDALVKFELMARRRRARMGPSVARRSPPPPVYSS